MRRILIYGDVDLNVIDGSSVWLTNLAKLLSMEEDVMVDVLLKKRIRILAVVDSLRHLHKGGRLPAAVALVGGALGIKPVLSVYDGAVHLADKARGRPGAYVAMFKQMDKMGGIDTRYDFVLVYSSDRLVLGPIQHYVQNNLKLTGGHISQIGSVIGTHIGPAAAGIAFVVPPQD